MRKILLVIIICGSFTSAFTQQKTDTVIVELAKTSKVIFTIKDKQDLEILKHYDFQHLFKDILDKLEQNDSSTTTLKDTTDHVSKNDDEDDEDGNDRHEHWKWHGHNRWGNTWQSFNFDLGTNNYIENGNSIVNNNSNYVVKPWGSWYVAATSVQRSRLAKKFFLEWGLGVSWYNFKFENEKTLIKKKDDGVVFEEDTRDLHYIKSKLTASYVNFSLIPVLDFSDDNVKHAMSNNRGDGNGTFRIGLGPYVGYRIGSHSKQAYRDDGDRKREKDNDQFYLNNLRYGVRLQVGFRSTDLFFNYDMNQLFASGKGPDLNAFSFGVVF